MVVIFTIPLLLQSFFDAGYMTDEPPDLKALRSLYDRPMDEWPAAWIDEGVDVQEWEPLPLPPILEDTSARTKALIRLGKNLFFDPRLSASKQISCSSCHDPDMHWTDGRKKAIGDSHRIGRRHTPSLQNIWYDRVLFWDGREVDIMRQARLPIEDANEMNTPMDTAVSHINAIAGYAPMIKAAFGNDTINADRLTEALGYFQLSIHSNITRFDNYLKGRYRALSDQQVWGLHLFRTKARCFNCHHGPFFKDGRFHNLGFSNYGKADQDLGRYEITRDPEDMGKFKTAGLRDAARTFPWFHDGRFGDMGMLINQYNAGMPQPKLKDSIAGSGFVPVQSPLLKPLGISLSEREALIRFMEALSSLPMSVQRPILPE